MQRKVKRALRLIVEGHTLTQAAALAGVHHITVHRHTRTPTGKRYMEQHRDRLDAHRVVLAATLPFLDLTKAIADGQRVRRSLPPDDEA